MDYRFPKVWAFTAAGEPSDDPCEITERGGSMMPLGGALKGHKGYGLGLMVELLGQGLSGKGRADAVPSVFGQSAFLQVIDPEAFTGLDAFIRQSDHLAQACRENPSAPTTTGAAPVPGDAAARKRRRALPVDFLVGEDQLAKLLPIAFGLELAFPQQV